MASVRAGARLRARPRTGGGGQSREGLSAGPAITVTTRRSTRWRSGYPWRPP